MSLRVRQHSQYTPNGSFGAWRFRVYGLAPHRLVASQHDAIQRQVPDELRRESLVEAEGARLRLDRSDRTTQGLCVHSALRKQRTAPSQKMAQFRTDFL